MTTNESLFSWSDAEIDGLERTAGVSTAVVTDNDDKKGLGRVRVRFPWSDKPSNWAPVLAPTAGDGRGLYCVPEVNDVVLVAFRGCKIDAPYVLGSIWNGKQKPPLPAGKGKSDQRIFKSRSGHTITLDDATGKEQISIVDKSGKNSVVIDSTANKITIKAAQSIELESEATISIKAKGAIEIKGSVVRINDDALEVT